MGWGPCQGLQCEWVRGTKKQAEGCRDNISSLAPGPMMQINRLFPTCYVFRGSCNGKGGWLCQTRLVLAAAETLWCLLPPRGSPGPSPHSPCSLSTDKLVKCEGINLLAQNTSWLLLLLLSLSLLQATDFISL